MSDGWQDIANMWRTRAHAAREECAALCERIGDETAAFYAAAIRALSEGQAAEPVAQDRYVQPVPDHCDRIVWRGQYFGLPLAVPAGRDAARAKAICQCAAEGSYYGRHASWCPLHGAKPAGVMGPVVTPELWRHRKSGGVYRIIVRAAILEADATTRFVIYTAEDGKGPTWARPYAEFFDGRFVREDAARSETQDE